MPENLPVLDIADALNRSLGDAEFLKMMMDEFEKTIPEFMTRLKNALDQNDMQSLGRDAHQFKGAAANLGAKAIAAIALELEKIGKSSDGNGAEEALSGLKVEVDKFNQKLSEIDWSAL